MFGKNANDKGRQLSLGKDNLSKMAPIRFKPKLTIPTTRRAGVVDMAQERPL